MAINDANSGTDFYQSDEWLELRYKALKRYGKRCHCCGTAGGTRDQIHVDHIQPRSKHPELALDIANLQILCRRCNLGKRAWDSTDWRPSDWKERLASRRLPRAQICLTGHESRYRETNRLEALGAGLGDPKRGRQARWRVPAAHAPLGGRRISR